MFEDFVKLIVGLVWPGVAAYAIWLFQDPLKIFIASFSNRSVKLGPQGVELAGPPQPTPAPERLDQGLQPEASSLAAVQSGGDSSDVTQFFGQPFRELIAENQNKVDTILSQLVATSGQSRETVLRRMCIDYDSALYLERASRYILGSQIDAIGFLSANGNTGTREQLRPFYAFGAASQPVAFALFPFEQWLSYLTSWNLATIHDESVNLTGGGKAIVPYMQAWGYLNLRPLG
jgi:hypothetical protein